MKLIIILLFLTSTAEARDCLKEAWNYHVGMSITGSINDLVDRYAEEKHSLSVCDEKVKNEIWASEIIEYEKGYQEKKKELARKGDVSSDILDFGSKVFGDEKHLTEKELCVKVDQKISEESSCYLPSSYLEKLKKTDFEKVNFKDACRQNLPTLYKLYTGCRSHRGRTKNTN